MQRLAQLLTLCALGACAGTPLRAEASHAPYTLEVEDAHGRALPSYRHRGQTYVLGRHGDRYVIRVHNHTAQRVEAVLSVDGRDVLTGQPGDFEGQRGYVVGPYQSITVEGFRQSLHGVAAFRFTSPGNSYSARMGTPQNVGIIGAAFFAERPSAVRRHSGHLRHRKPRADREGAGYDAAPRGGERQAAPSSAAPEREAPARTEARPRPADRSANGSADAHFDHDDDHSHIGTEYGEHRRSPVREVRFVRRDAQHPDRVLTLRYDDARGLEERGIALYPPRPPRGPQAFPVSRFAPPPPARY